MRFVIQQCYSGGAEVRIYYTVKPGDCISSIGARYGFTWQALWDLPENADLRALRKDPYVLNPGDKVFVPDIRKKVHDRPTDQKHPFTKLGTKEQLRIVFIDEDDKPMVNAPYELVIDDHLHYVGHTGGDGSIVHKISRTAAKGHLVVGESNQRQEYYFRLGTVDPVTEISGVKGRLLDLGYYDGHPGGALDGPTQSALLLFQDKYHLAPTAKNDGDTQAKLKKIFGC